VSPLGEFGQVSRNLERLADLLYGGPRESAEVPISTISDALRDLGSAEVENLIQRMNDAGLLQVSLAGDLLRLNAAGIQAHSNACTSEVVLGAQFIGTKYRSAIVHIIVRTEHGDESGGTGFFVAEPQNQIVTARHLFDEGRSLVRIEDIGGNVIAREVANVRLAPGRPDLASIRCEMPGEVTAFRIDWDDYGTEEFDEVLIFGYPPLAGHNVALISARAQVIALAPLTGESGRHSIIISRVVAPGCSGGPVVSSEGLVVGVLSRDNIVARIQPPDIVYTSATPARYLRDLAPVD
jgi:hypothetical protein